MPGPFFDFPVGFKQVKSWKEEKCVAQPGQINLLIASYSYDIRLKRWVQETGS